MPARSGYRTVLPFGFPVVMWTTGGVLIAHHGAPTLFEAYLFLAGAVVGFGAVAPLAGGRPAAEFREGVASAVGAAVALGCGGACASIPGRAAYFAVALVSTLAYYLARAAAAAHL